MTEDSSILNGKPDTWALLVDVIQPDVACPVVKGSSSHESDFEAKLEYSKNVDNKSFSIKKVQPRSRQKNEIMVLKRRGSVVLWRQY